MESLKKTVLTGIGMALLARDRVEELAKELADKADLSEKEGREFVDDVLKGAEEARKKFEERVDSAVRDALAKMHVATREDLEALERRVAAIEAPKLPASEPPAGL